jgi:hypothetical protein
MLRRADATVTRVNAGVLAVSQAARYWLRRLWDHNMPFQGSQLTCGKAADTVRRLRTCLGCVANIALHHSLHGVARASYLCVTCDGGSKHTTGPTIPEWSPELHLSVYPMTQPVSMHRVSLVAPAR